METLKYKVIKNKRQYAEYCNALDQLITRNDKSKATKEEVELLTLLIEKNGMRNTIPFMMLTP